MEERTLLFIKPDIVAEKKTGEIIKILEENGFEILSLKKVKLTKKQVEEFYKIHKGKDFFKSLVEYISSGEIVAVCVKKENAVKDLRKLVGATDPEKAEEGTIRRKFGKNIQKNAVHASAPDENPEREIHFFFSEIELL